MAHAPDRPVEGIRWPRRYGVVALCFAASFICYIDRVNISVAAIRMQEVFGWSDTTKGLVLSSFFVGYMLLQVPSGWLANRYGGKIVLGLAVVWWSLFTILTPPAALNSLPLLIAARIALGLGEGATFPAVYNLLGRWVAATERSRAVAVVLSGVPLGTLFALTTSGWLVARYDWPMVFYLFGAVGFVWAIVWFWWVDEHPPAELPGPRAASQPPAGFERYRAVPWRALLSKSAVWALVTNHFCSNWCLYVFLAWLPSYFQEAQGVTITGAGLYSAAPWLTMFVMINACGWLADHLMKRGISPTSVRKLMQSIGLLGSAAFLWFARDAGSANEALFLLCGALGLLAFTWSGFLPNHLEIAPRHADVMMGLTNTFGTIPGIVGVAVTGWLVDISGTYAAAFALTAVVNVVGAVVWLAFGTARRVVE